MLKQNSKTNTTMDLTNAVVADMFPGMTLSSELLGDIAQYVQYKLDFVQHCEIHTGNAMFMKILQKHAESDKLTDPYKVIGDKMYIIRRTSVWLSSEAQHMTRLWPCEK